MPNTKVVVKKVYSKESHTKKPEHGYAPVYSYGKREGNEFRVTIHMTPELKKHPKIRNDHIRHEIREAKLLAKGVSVAKAHKQVRRQDPDYFKHGGAAWDKLGHKNKFWHPR